MDAARRWRGQSCWLRCEVPYKPTFSATLTIVVLLFFFRSCRFCRSRPGTTAILLADIRSVVHCVSHTFARVFFYASLLGVTRMGFPSRVDIGERTCPNV